MPRCVTERRRVASPIEALHDLARGRREALAVEGILFDARRAVYAAGGALPVQAAALLVRRRTDGRRHVRLEEQKPKVAAGARGAPRACEP